MQKQMDDKIKFRQSFALFTLLPFPLCVLLEVLIGIIFWLIPNSGNAPGWIANVGEAVCCLPYLVSILLAIVGEILSLTAWRSSRTLWTNILIWLNPILIAIHVLVIGYIYYEIIYAHPFTF